MNVHVSFTGRVGVLVHMDIPPTVGDVNLLGTLQEEDSVPGVAGNVLEVLVAADTVLEVGDVFQPGTLLGEEGNVLEVEGIVLEVDNTLQVGYMVQGLVCQVQGRRGMWLNDLADGYRCAYGPLRTFVHRG